MRDLNCDIRSCRKQSFEENPRRTTSCKLEKPSVERLTSWMSKSPCQAPPARRTGTGL
jgi:hypothetical protein